MGCVSSSEERFRTRSKPCKSGYMLYSDGFNKWNKVFAILFEDSMLAWFKKPKERRPICHVTLQNVCHMLAVGPVCKKIPNCPKKIPKKTSYSYMIAFPQWAQPGATGANLTSPVCFFLCPNGNSMGEWMTAISKTLPPPPVPNGTTAAYPSAPPPAYAQNGQPMGYGQPPGYGQPQPPPPSYGYQPQQPQQTQVVVNNRRSGSGDMTKGFLLGAAIGYGYGHPWGWGWGWGWGYHPCYGWGYGDYDMDVDVDVDVDVNVEGDAGDLGSVNDFGGSDFADYGDPGGEGVGDTDFGFDDGGGDYGGGDYGGGDYGGGDYGGGDAGGGDGGGGGGCGGCGGGGCGGCGGCGG